MTSPSYGDASQPIATQPSTFLAEADSFEQSDCEETATVWGRLFPETKEFDTLELTEATYVFGRHPTCSVTFSDPVISNRHCVITRERPLECASQYESGEYVVFVQDTSSNGTFVNGKRIGNGKRIAIKHGDHIAVTQKRSAGAAPSYVFHDCTTAVQETGTDPLSEKYNILKKLGSGTFSEVFLAVNKHTGRKYAVKKIPKKHFSQPGTKPLSTESLLQEVEILRKLDHPNVVGIVEMFDSDDMLAIVLELAKGGELFDRITKKTKFCEAEARFVLLQLLNAVKYLHEHGVVHRDLKPENVLLCGNEDYCIVKVTDFGLAKLVGDQSYLKTTCGTPSYLAPEVLKAIDGSSAATGYTKQVDVWSLGVIAYIMLVGFPPFSDDIGWHDKKYTLVEQVMLGKLAFPSPWWDGISPEAIDLVKRMLVVDPDARITIGDCLAHPFLADEETRLKLEHKLAARNGPVTRAGAKRKKVE